MAGFIKKGRALLLSDMERGMAREEERVAEGAKAATQAKKDNTTSDLNIL